MKKLSFALMAALLVVSLPFSSLASSSASGSEIELTGSFFRIGWVANNGDYDSTQALRADGTQFATVPGDPSGLQYFLRDIDIFVYGDFQADKDYMLEGIIYSDSTQWDDGEDVALTYHYSNGSGTLNTSNKPVISGSYERLSNLYSGGITGYAYRFKMQAIVNGDTSPCLTVKANMNQSVAFNTRSYTVSNVHVYEVDKTETGVFSIFDLITNLPNKIIELFVPPADLLSNVYDEWDAWLEEHFGILYFPFHFANNVIFTIVNGYVPPQPPQSNDLAYINRYSTIVGRPGVLLFPGLTLNFNGTAYRIWDAQPIDFPSFFDEHNIEWIVLGLRLIIGYEISIRFLAWICERMNSIFPDNAIFGFLAGVFNKLAGPYDFMEGMF